MISYHSLHPTKRTTRDLSTKIVKSTDILKIRILEQLLTPPYQKAIHQRRAKLRNKTIRTSQILVTIDNESLYIYGRLCSIFLFLRSGSLFLFTPYMKEMLMLIELLS